MAPTKTDALIITNPGGADAILADYELRARPLLARLADVAEEVRDLLVARFGESEGGRLAAVKRLHGTVDPALLREATVVRMDVKSAEDRAIRELDRWLADAQAEAAAAKVAADPEPDAQARGIADLVEAQALAGRLLVDLRAEGLRLAAQGDARGANVRLMAARLTGEQRHPAQLRDLVRAVDRLLDEKVPHRKAAADADWQARLAWSRARLAMVEVSRLVVELGQADPTRPDAVVARARARCGADGRT